MSDINTVYLSLEKYNELFEDHLRLLQAESNLAEAYGDNADLVISRNHLQDELDEVKKELEKAESRASYWFQEYRKLEPKTVTTVATTAGVDEEVVEVG